MAGNIPQESQTLRSPRLRTHLELVGVLVVCVLSKASLGDLSSCSPSSRIGRGVDQTLFRMLTFGIGRNRLGDAIFGTKISCVNSVSEMSRCHGHGNNLAPTSGGEATGGKGGGNA
jgi:hypothetical protein